MSTKHIKGVIIPRHDIEANWNKATNFIPKMGELIVYDPDETTPKTRFKFGRGITVDGKLTGPTVNELPFTTTDVDGYVTYDEMIEYVAENGGVGITRRTVEGSEVELDDVFYIQSDIIIRIQDENGNSIEGQTVKLYNGTSDDTLITTVVSGVNGNIPIDSIQYPYTRLVLENTTYTIYAEYDATVSGGTGTLGNIDQAYNPESENAQSGKAVAEALEGFAGGGNGSAENWEVISDTTTEFDTPVSQIVINQDTNGNSFSLKKMKVLIDFTVAEEYTALVRAGTTDANFMYFPGQNFSAGTVYGYMIESEVLPMVNNLCPIISRFNDTRMIENGNVFNFSYNGGAVDFAIRTQKRTVTTLANSSGISDFYFTLSSNGKINKARILILGVKE